MIVRDKLTHESKGSAFVWYATRADADRAALQLNVRHMLPDPVGEQDRPLAVRRANTRKQAVVSASAPVNAYAPGAGAAYVGSGGAGSAAVLAVQQQHAVAGAGAMVGLEPYGFAGHAGGEVQAVQLQPVVLQDAMSPVGQVVYHPVTTGAPQQQPQISAAMGQRHGHSGAWAGAGGGPGGQQQFIMQGELSGGCIMQAYTQVGAQAGDATPTSSAGNGILSGVSTTLANPVLGPGGLVNGSINGLMSSGTGLLSSGATALVSGGLDRSSGGISAVGASGSTAGVSGNGGGGNGELVTMQVPLMAGQMAAITAHIYSIQTMSGAEVTSQAVAPGVFCLLLRGRELQVETANQLIATLLQNTP